MKCTQCRFYNEILVVDPTDPGDCRGYCQKYPPISNSIGCASYPQVREKNGYVSNYTPRKIDYCLDACSKFKEKDA